MTRVSKRHIIISGFLQNRLLENGLDRIYMELLKFSKPECQVDFYNWDSDWRAIAEFIKRTGPDQYSDLDIRCYAYSWGCGYGFTRLARYLNKIGIPISAVVMSDPVYYPGILKYRALFSSSVIKIPDNVENCWYFHQKQNRPRGHLVVSSRPVVRSLGELSMTHQYMDDAPQFRDACIKIAGLDKTELNKAFENSRSGNTVI